ncbi:MAG: ribosome assembly RNA-binding protein YhbY [Enterobacteriaceae bacterium]
MKTELKPFQRRYLQGLAHHLNPVVMIGNNGLTESVLREIDLSLNTHELIKIRVAGEEREARSEALQQICQKVSAAAVQQIGKVLVIWRPSDKQLIRLPASKPRQRS